MSDSMRRKFLTAAAAFAVTAGALFAGAGEGRAADPVKMKLAYATGASFLHHAAAQVFKAEVEKATNGALTVSLHPGAQLGGEAQILEGLRAGTIEAYLGTLGAVSNFAPELGIVDLPYLWRGYDHAYKVLGGPLGDQLRAAAGAKGFNLVGYWPAGRRDIYGNVKIEKPEDLKGVKIRTLQSPIYLATFKAFGALPTPLAWPETYGALQQRVIDASETALSAMMAESQHEVIKFVTLTNHGLTIAGFVAAKGWHDGLAPNIKAAIAAAEEKGRAKAIELEKEGFDAAVAKLRAAGKTVTTPDHAAFQKLVRETVYPQFADRYDPKLIAEILK